MIEASAPAKIILVGEHAVVYGQPAIAVPVSSLRAVASVEPNDHEGLRIAASDLGTTISLDEQPDAALAVTAQMVLQALNAPPPDVTISLRSRIPMASGLGSGAAVATALARALSTALNRPLENDALNAIVYEVEKIHHGTPSGIDNSVVVYEKPIFFVRGDPITFFRVQSPFTLLIANTGIAYSTRTVVEDVRKLYEAEPQRIQRLIHKIGRRAIVARPAIAMGDLWGLGVIMSRNHVLLQQLTVSSPELDNLVSAARNAGALGAKMSGGGRGGNMIALVTAETAERVRQALLDAGATSVIETTVE
jgi:mevalonate kinase